MEFLGLHLKLTPSVYGDDEALVVIGESLTMKDGDKTCIVGIMWAADFRAFGAMVAEDYALGYLGEHFDVSTAKVLAERVIHKAMPCTHQGQRFKRPCCSDTIRLALAEMERNLHAGT